MALTLSELKKVSMGPVGMEPEKDRTNIKIIGLAFFGVLFAAIFGYTFKLFLTHQDFILFSSLNWSLFAFLFFLIFFLLQIFFVEEFWKVFVAILIEWFGFFLAFNFDKIKILAIPDWKFLVVFGISILLAFVSLKKGKDAIQDSIKIKFFKINKAVMPTAIAAMFLFVSGAYVYGIDKKDFVVPYSDFQAVFSSSDVFVAKIYPGFTSSWTINELANYLAQNQIEQMPQFDALSKSAKKQLTDVAVKEFEKKASDFFGAPLNAKLKISEAIYEILKNKLMGFSANVQILLSISILLLMFLLLESVAIFVRWIVSIAAFVLYEILLAAEFAKISYEGISKERITLK
ncbi:hypothetical protein HZC33_01565 [Candidatus Wolfebacteria bacterium]|nr:hypothetical protein [Candidatus Wolfebacteria bacterium]